MGEMCKISLFPSAFPVSWYCLTYVVCIRRQVPVFSCLLCRLRTYYIIQNCPLDRCTDFELLVVVLAVLIPICIYNELILNELDNKFVRIN